MAFDPDDTSFLPKKPGRPFGCKNKTPEQRFADVKDGAVGLINGRGEVELALSTALLGREFLREFGGYVGIAKSVRFTYETTTSFAVKLKCLQLIGQTIRQAEQQAPVDLGLAGLSEKQLDQLYAKKIALLVQQGMLDPVLQEVGRKIGPGGIPIVPSGPKDGAEVIEATVAKERNDNLAE